MEFYRPPTRSHWLIECIKRRWREIGLGAIAALLVAIAAAYLQYEGNRLNEIEAYPALSLRCDEGAVGASAKKYFPSKLDNRDDFIEITGATPMYAADLSRSVATCEVDNDGRLAALNVTLAFAVHSGRVGQDTSLRNFDTDTALIERIAPNSRLYVWFVDNQKDRLFSVAPMQSCSYEVQGDSKQHDCGLRKITENPGLPFLRFPVVLWPQSGVPHHAATVHFIKLRPMTVRLPSSSP